MSKTKKLIESLTPEQEAEIAKYREEFRNFGTNTKPVDRAAAESAVKRSYAYLKLKEPQFVWVDSPFAAVKLLKDKDPNPRSGINYAPFEAYWASFYCFVAEQLPVVKNELVEIVRDIIMNCGVYWTYTNYVIMSERPVNLYFDNNRNLHNPNGLAMEFKDGTGVYSLNGIRMPEWIFTTPKEEIKPEDLLKIVNVEQRAEALKWYGLEKLLHKLAHKVLDTRDDYNYALLEITLTDDISGKFLKMDNPSVEGEIHIEGVGKHCMTVEDALKDRWPKSMLEKYKYSEALERA